MRVFARLLILALMAAMLVSNLPLPLASTPEAEGPGNVTDGSETFIVGEGGEGLTFSSHMATATDVLDMIDVYGVYDPAVNYNVMFGEFGTGLAPGTMEDYADLVGNVNLVDDVTISPGGELPAAVDHSTEPYFPIADTQGGQGSCGSWAVAYYTNGYLQAKDNGFTEAHNGSNSSHLMSPAWVYNKINYGVDSGSNWYRNMALLSSVGNADLETMPYNWRDLYGWGDEDAWRNAAKYRVESQYDLTAATNTQVIKAWLAEGYVLPMAFDATEYHHLGDDIITAAEYNSNAANHANTIVGYNDSITADGEAGAFLIMNSWGETWSGNGMYWMTYDCLTELYWAVMRVHDKVDYEPELLGTIHQSTVGSKESIVHMGTTSGDYSYRRPLWWAGTYAYPEFMALDLTEMVEDVSLADFYCTFGSGTTPAIIDSFEVEWYLDGYDPGNPTFTAASSGMPVTAPATMYATFSGVHIDQTVPERNTWHRDEVTINGTATGSIPREVLSEDFEGRWTSVWNTEDTDAAGGRDTWGVSTTRMRNGEKSAWAAASDGGIVLYQGFESASTPTDWATTSLGPDKYPFTFVNTGYQGAGGSDYIAVADSNRGAGTNMTERLHTSTPVNASNFENLTLRFYISYDHFDGDEYVSVQFANASTYPNYTTLVTYSADTFGYQAIDLSAQDGEEAVYLAFEYHGTADRYVTLDDILLAGDKPRYDPNMGADLYIASGNLSGYDTVTLTYDHWVDTENGTDLLYAMYRSSSTGPWVLLSNHTGALRTWTETTVEVPNNATHVGFRFFSDGANSSEGAYLDDVTLTGHVSISTIEVSVDGGPWQQGTAKANWSFVWKTSALDDGMHDLVARVNYSGAYDQVAFQLLTDNTPPVVSKVWNETASTGEATVLHVTARDDLNGVASVHVAYVLNALPETIVEVTIEDNGTWDFPLSIPLNAIDLSYSFILLDTIGNEVETTKVQVQVIDNDDPSMGPDNTPTEATTGDPLEFSLSAEDNIQIGEITLEYWYEGGTVETVTLPLDEFEHVITVADSLEPIHYRFIIEDTSKNGVEGEVRSVRVSDNDAPSIDDDRTPSEATTGENVTFLVHMADNIELNGTWVEYWFGGGEHVNSSMETVSEWNWTLTVDVPLDSLSPLHYIFNAQDSSGNWNSTGRSTVTILDNDLPWFGNDLSPDKATTGDQHLFEVQLYDNIGVVDVQVEYWYDNGTHRTADMSSGDMDTWAAEIVTSHTIRPMHYVFHVADSSGNMVTSELRDVEMRDNDEPIIMADTSPGSTTTGVAYEFTVTITDNLGVSGVDITYWFDEDEQTFVPLTGASLDGNGNGTYTLIIQIPPGSTDPLLYQVEARDSVGNVNLTAERTILVLDVTLPLAEAGPDINIDQHEAATFSSEGSGDNVGITTFTWTIERGVDVVTLSGPSPVHTFDAAGTYAVTLTVEDPSGNTDTDTSEVTVNDITPPDPNAGEDRTVDQNTTVILDGTRSRDNVAIDSWTWNFEYSRLPKEIPGQDIRFIFDIPGIYAVTLTVEDRAGNVNTTTVIIKVKDTDYPEARTHGDMEGRLDEAVTLNGSRSRDNVGIVNWTWTVHLDGSGSTFELYGEELKYVFDEPGDHKVTLTVSDADGNIATSDEFTVHVPNTPLWMALILILLASVGVTLFLAYYTRWKTHKLDEEISSR